jgi:hypothetical protein
VSKHTPDAKSPASVAEKNRDPLESPPPAFSTFTTQVKHPMGECRKQADDTRARRGLILGSTPKPPTACSCLSHRVLITTEIDKPLSCAFIAFQLYFNSHQSMANTNFPTFYVHYHQDSKASPRRPSCRFQVQADHGNRPRYRRHGFLLPCWQLRQCSRNGSTFFRFLSMTLFGYFIVGGTFLALFWGTILLLDYLI